MYERERVFLNSHYFTVTDTIVDRLIRLFSIKISVTDLIAYSPHLLIKVEPYKFPSPLLRRAHWFSTVTELGRLRAFSRRWQEGCFLFCPSLSGATRDTHDRSSPFTTNLNDLTSKLAAWCDFVSFLSFVFFHTRVFLIFYIRSLFYSEVSEPTKKID